MEGDIFMTQNTIQFPAWLETLREEAKTLMQTKALPKAEKTVIKNFGFENITTMRTEKECNVISESVAHLVCPEDENVIVVNDGVIVHQKLSDAFKNVVVANLTDAFTTHESLFKPHFMSAAKVDEHQLTASHVANLNSGLFIYVPKNEVVTEELNIVYLQESGSFVHHTMIVADTSSSFKYIENYATTTEAVVNMISEVIVLDNASVEHSSMDHFKEDVVVYSKKASNVSNYGRYNLSLGALNDGNVVYETNVNLNGEGAFSEVKTVAVSDKAQKQNLTISIEHFAPFTEGYIVNHGVSKDEGQLVFNGIGKINKGMRQSVAKQETRSMILSENAVAAANPILLIDEYDVKAGHAAGVGKIDDEQLYYLMSRGLTRQEAEVLIIYGFLMPFVNEIKNENLKEMFAKIIEQKINL